MDATEWIAWALVLVEAVALVYLALKNSKLSRSPESLDLLAVENRRAANLEKVFRDWRRELETIMGVVEEWARNLPPTLKPAGETALSKIADYELKGKELPPDRYNELPDLDELKTSLGALLDKGECEHPLPDDWYAN